MRIASIIWVCLWICCVSARGQVNQVLTLDGSGAHVDLPGDVFNGLESATVEAWVKWNSFEGEDQRVFNYGKAWSDFSLGANKGGGLRFIIATGRGKLNEIGPPIHLRLNEWYHLAGVCGPQGMMMLLNGAPIGTNAFTGGFQSLQSGGRNLIGQTVSERDPDVRFNGQIDELRVWKEARTPEQIRAGMFERLNGRERGLAGLWNFDDGSARDASPAGNHGKLVSGARTEAFPIPAIETRRAAAVVQGRVAMLNGSPIHPAVVRVSGGGMAPLYRINEPNGSFAFAASGASGPIDVRVNCLSGVTNLTLNPEALFRGDPLNLVFRAGGGSATTTNAFVRALGESIDHDPAEFRNLLRRIDLEQMFRFAPQLKEIAPSIIGAMKTFDPGARVAIAFALSKLGVSAVPMIEALNEALHGSDANMRGLTLLTLRSLEVPAGLEDLYVRKSLAGATLFACLLLPFALIHFLLFIFYPENKGNLYYALFTFSGSLLTYTIGQGMFGFFITPTICLTFLLLGLRLLYYLFYERLPRAFWVWLALAVGLLGCNWIGIDALKGSFSFQFNGNDPDFNAGGAYIMLVGIMILLGLAMIVEMIRVLIRSIFKGIPGAWIVGFGFLTLLSSWLMFLLLWGMVFGGKISVAQFSTVIQYFPHAGIAAFVLCASIHLARIFARTYRELSQATMRIETQNRDLLAATAEAEGARKVAEAASNAKSHFLANMSHELRTPLNAIIGYSEMLEEEVVEAGSSTMAPDLRKIQSAARHQLALINDILDLSKIEAGRMTICVDEFDLATVTREIAATVEPMMLKNQNRFELDCAEGIGRMRSDETKVRQILFNLLSNAAKFTEKGVIRLVVRAVEAHLAPPPPEEAKGAAPTKPGKADAEAKAAVVAGKQAAISFSVSDTGIGMTPEQVGRIFHSFTQAEVTTSRKYGGTGLGLALSKKFCHMLGGDLTVKTEMGHGSTFEAVVPRELVG